MHDFCNIFIAFQKKCGTNSKMPSLKARTLHTHWLKLRLKRIGVALQNHPYSSLHQRVVRARVHTLHASTSRIASDLLREALAIPAPHITQQSTQHNPHHTHAYRSEEHTSELQSLMRISYTVFCLKKTITKTTITSQRHKT